MNALFQHASVPSHLPQPARHDRCAHAFGVEHHDPRAAHGQVLVGGLHQLAAGRVLRPRQGALRELFGAAHVAQERRAGGVEQPRLHRAGIHHRYVMALG
ncbi:hypothetical protein D3C73_1116480 [compost metagenome]